MDHVCAELGHLLVELPPTAPLTRGLAVCAQGELAKGRWHICDRLRRDGVAFTELGLVIRAQGALDRSGLRLRRPSSPCKFTARLRISRRANFDSNSQVAGCLDRILRGCNCRLAVALENKCPMSCNCYHAARCLH